MGQGNYIAANSWLDKIPFYERPEVDSVTLMWGAVGNIGMRWKAFASADFLNATPEALLSIDDARKVLCITCTKMDPPEWYAGSFFDEYSRQGMLHPTAGGGTGGGWRPGEDSGVPGVHDYGPAPAVGGQSPVSKEWLVELKRDPDKEKDDVGSRWAAIREAAGPMPLVSPNPLSGWAAILEADAAAEVARPLAAPDPSLVAPAPVVAAPATPQLPVVPGARVELHGLGSKSGNTGLVLKSQGDGRWKVQLDDGSGDALLKECFLEVIDEAAFDAGAANSERLQMAAMRNKENFARKREKLRARMVSAQA